MQLGLPTIRTLGTFLSHLPFKPGPNSFIYDGLKTHFSKIDDPKKKIGVLVFDEMKHLPHLDVDTDGSLTGLEDWGPIKNNITEAIESSRTCRFADHLIVFMLRMLYDGRKIVLQHGFCKAQTKKHELAHVVKDILKRLSECGVNIVAFACDRGSSNVAMITSMIAESNRHRSDNNTMERGKDVFHY